jgi:hypothetical protein
MAFESRKLRVQLPVSGEHRLIEDLDNVDEDWVLCGWTCAWTWGGGCGLGHTVVVCDRAGSACAESCQIESPYRTGLIVDADKLPELIEQLTERLGELNAAQAAVEARGSTGT